MTKTTIDYHFQTWCKKKNDTGKMPCKNLVRGHFTKFIVFDKFEKDVRQ